MTRESIVIKGHLVSPTNVELEEPVSDLTQDVEVVLRPPSRDDVSEAQTVSEFLRALPDGTRNKQDIDEQLGSERRAWDEAS